MHLGISGDAKEDNDEFWDVETNEHVSEAQKPTNMDSIGKGGVNTLSKSEWFDELF